MATVTDPVCGMQIDSSQAVAQTVYNGKGYFFCSDECRKMFVENPEKYLKSEKSADAPIPLP